MPRPNVKLRRKKEDLPEDGEPKEEIVLEEQPQEAPAQEPEIQEEATPVADLEPEEAQEQSEEEQIEDEDGRFIVETLDGYYAGPDRIAYKQDDAVVFNSYKEALSVMAEVGGKVIKL